MEPVVGAAVWRSGELERSGAWSMALDPPELGELEGGGDAGFERLAARCERIRHELEHGCGVVRLTGWDVAAHHETALEQRFLAFARQLGTPVSQSTSGDLMFRVADAGLSASDARARGPNSRKALTFHSDRCDVIGFLCVRKAASGGENIVVSAGALHNAIAERRPDLLKVLYETFYWKRHNIDTANERAWYRMPVFAREDGQFAVTLMQVLIDRAHAMPELPDLTAPQREALDLVQSLAAEPAFQLRFVQQPGEILLLNNFVTLHSRTEFTDDPGTAGRLLLRVWISVPGNRPLPESWAAHYGGHQADTVRGGIRTAG